MVQSCASLPRLRTDFPTPVAAEAHCRPNLPPGNITRLEVQTGNRGAQMEEVGLPQTCMRGHRPKEKMPAVMGESWDLSQFSTQQSLQTLATVHLVYTTSQIQLDLTESSFAVPLATSSTSMVSAPQKHSIGNCGVVDSDPNSESAAQNRNLLVWNSSPGQKVGVATFTIFDTRNIKSVLIFEKLSIYDIRY